MLQKLCSLKNLHERTFLRVERVRRIAVYQPDKAKTVESKIIITIHKIRQFVFDPHPPTRPVPIYCILYVK